MRKPNEIKTTLAITGSDQRVVLHYWATSSEPRLQNVARIDRDGRIMWRAELPGAAAHDCFVRLERSGERFVAHTWSGRRLFFDADGQRSEAA